MLEVQGSIPSQTYDTEAGNTGAETPELIELIQKRFRYARSARARYARKWREYLRLYLGNHWEEVKFDDGRSYYVANYIWGFIQQMFALLTDGRPKLILLPHGRDDVNKAEFLMSAVDFMWSTQQFDFGLEKVIMNALIFGKGIGKVYYDPFIGPVLSGIPQGDFRIDSVSPFYFYPQPGCDELEKCSWVIHAEPRPIEWIKRNYQIDVQPEETVSLPQGDEYYSELYLDPTEGHRVEDIPTLASLDENRTGYLEGTQRAMVVDYWEKRVVPQPLLAPDTGEPIMGEDGQPVIINTEHLLHGTMIQAKIARQEVDPFPRAIFPFFEILNNHDPGSYWGIGEPAQLQGPQEEFNKRKVQVIEHFAYMTVGRLLMPIECGVNTDLLTNTPGETIKYRGSTGLKPTSLFPISPPDAFFRHQEEVRKDMEFICGVHEVMSGRAPKGVEAASAIAELQEAAQSRLRPKTRHVENGIAQLGRVLLNMMPVYYTVPRIIRLMEGDNIKFDMLDLMAFQTGGVLDFDVYCESGASMKAQRDAKNRQAQELIDRQIIDDITYLELIDFPKIDLVMERKYGILGRILRDPNLMPIRMFLEQEFLPKLMSDAAAFMQQPGFGAMGGGTPPPPPSTPSQQGGQ